MSRIDWVVVLTLVGILGLFGAALDQSQNAQHERYQSYRYAADKPLEADPALSRVTGPQPLEYRRPCYDPKGKDESDLCAQWRAAKAAENSAFWAKWGFWIAVIGSAFLLWQINLTRQAVEDTGDATDAMREANQIARDAMEKQLRAYLSVSHAEIEIGDSHLSVRPRVKNSGQTQALDVTLSLPMKASASGYGPPNSSFTKIDGIGNERRMTVGVIPPSVQTEMIWFGWNAAQTNFDCVPELVISSEGRHSVMVSCNGRLEWKDIFGVSYELTVTLFWERIDLTKDKRGRFVLSGDPVITHGVDRIEPNSS